MEISAFAAKLAAETEKIILGKHDRIELIIAALLAGGHILLDDLPGVGKTTLVKTLSLASGCASRRVQFVPDLLPSDITGCPTAMVYHVGSGTSGSKYNPFKVKLAARNNIYLNYKNMPLLQLAVNLVPILLGMGLKYMFFKKKGFGRDYAAGVKEGLATAKKCRKVPYSRERLKNYLAIEWELITGTLIYVYEFAARQIAKL